MAKARKKPESQVTGEEPQGSDRVAYDQTDPMVDTGAAPQAAGDMGADPGAQLTTGEPNLAAQQADMITNLAPTFGPSGPPQPAPGGAPDPGALGGAPVNSDQLTGAQLGQMAGAGQPSPEELIAAQLQDALNNPSTPPDQRASLQQMMDIAARRRMAGMGSSAGGLGA